MKINHDGYEQIPFSLILVVAMGISLKKKKTLCFYLPFPYNCPQESRSTRVGTSSAYPVLLSCDVSFFHPSIILYFHPSQAARVVAPPSWLRHLPQHPPRGSSTPHTPQVNQAVHHHHHVCNEYYVIISYDDHHNDTCSLMKH